MQNGVDGRLSKTTFLPRDGFIKRHLDYIGIEYNVICRGEVVTNIQ